MIGKEHRHARTLTECGPERVREWDKLTDPDKSPEKRPGKEPQALSTGFVFLFKN